MIFTDFHFFSEVLGIQTAAYVLLPDEKVMKQSKEPLPVLYLLHGLSDDHTMWMRQTMVEQFARQYRLCIVMPAANRSFYMDMAHGAKYDTFIAEELPRVIETYFPVGRKREHRFAAGLSMGGYGAMKLGLTRPGRYAAVASLSGALDMLGNYERRKEINPDYLAEMDDIYGSEKQLKNGKGNLNRLADKLAKTPEKAPKMYVACGTEDFLFAANEGFHARYGKVFDMEYHTEPGIHNWPFWNRHIERVLAWLPLEKAKEKE
ncbi:MAG: alpha/beta hydrolase family protein [Clostridia bacterium]|nr:alpha/beta hydrolase family protein [Clostridia bacterium]